MSEKRTLAAVSRERDLPAKYLACNPLPDPLDEKDLNTFITLWSEQKDTNLEDAVNNCQTAENVIKLVNELLAESLA